MAKMQNKNKKNEPNIPLLSTFSSRKTWEVSAWNAFVKHISGRAHMNETRAFLDLVLTPTERKNILLRATAIARLQNGIGPSEVSKELWLTRQTISAIKKAIRERSYRSYNERGKTERKERALGSILPERKPYRRRVRTKYGVIEMRPF